EGAEMVGVSVHAGVEAAHGLPVPTGTDIEDGVDGRRRLGVALQREKHQRPKFVEHGIARHLRDGGIGELERLIVPAFEKSGAGLVKLGNGLRRNPRRKGRRRRLDDRLLGRLHWHSTDRCGIVYHYRIAVEMSAYV